LRSSPPLDSQEIDVRTLMAAKLLGIETAWYGDIAWRLLA
jgi:hypothetical protein